MIRLCALLLVALGLAAEEDKTRFGEPLTLKDTTDKSHRIPDENAATVLVFLTTDCPIANNYAPEVKSIQADYAKKPINFLRVYPDEYDDAEDIGKHTKEFGYEIPAVADAEQALVKRTGARVTPEAVVIAKDGTIIYRGRIDDRYVELGRYRQKATTRDLRDALDAALEGKAPALSRTKAIGCYIPAM